MSEQIAKLNDQLRKNIWMPGPKNKVMITSALMVDPELAADAIAAVRHFNAFTEDNDPYGEHDMGFFEVRGNRCFWKIDYFDNDLTFHSPDPADPSVTIRVLTVGLASDY